MELTFSTSSYINGAWSRATVEDRCKQALLMADGVEEIEDDMAVVESYHTGEWLQNPSS
jgi:hypothetical protein